MAIGSFETTIYYSVQAVLDIYRFGSNQTREYIEDDAYREPRRVILSGKIRYPSLIPRYTTFL